MNSQLLEAIARSEDVNWLEKCQAFNFAKGDQTAVTAAKERLEQLAVKRALHRRGENQTLEERVEEAVRVYEVFLRQKHGRKQTAGYTRRDIKNLGARGAVIKTVRQAKMTEGLKALVEHGRLDCAYEQIALDFPDEFPADVVELARQMLADLEGA